MAAKGGNQKSRKADPMRTKNGKERLGPLNIAQLEKLLTNARKKTAPKIQSTVFRCWTERSNCRRALSPILILN